MMVRSMDAFLLWTGRLACLGILAGMWLPAAIAQRPVDTRPIRCDACVEWNADRAPFRVFGNTYYVGVEGLSAVLVTSPQGHVLLDGALPQSAPLIAAHVQALGFQLKDIRWILNSHAHYDHAGGIAALARLSGAQVAASPRGAQALRLGQMTKDDPQAGYHPATPFPKVAGVTEVPDGGSVQVGALRIVAHHTPGHTPGATSWTWRSCEGARCVDLVYADSLNPVSAPGFRFSAAQSVGAAAFRKSIDTLAALPCDILISVHPEFSSLFKRQAAAAFVDPGACRAYAEDGRKRLEHRLAEEAAKTPAQP